jgi:hypothetical protein
LFLSVVGDLKEESYANAYVADLIDFTWGIRVPAERKIVWSADWVTVVRNLWKDGDLVICPAEQSIPVNGNSIPLGAALSGESEIPVLMFEGYYREYPLHPRTRLAEMKWWSIAAMIIALSTCLEVWIFRNIKGWSNPVLLCLSLIVEYGFIWIWNRSG